MIVSLWLRGPAQLLIPPATLHVFAVRLGSGAWHRALHIAILSARVRYWTHEWELAMHHPHAMFDPRWPARLTVTIVEGDTHAG